MFRLRGPMAGAEMAIEETLNFRSPKIPGVSSRKNQIHM